MEDSGRRVHTCAYLAGQVTDLEWGRLAASERWQLGHGGAGAAGHVHLNSGHPGRHLACSGKSIPPTAGHGHPQ